MREIDRGRIRGHSAILRPPVDFPYAKGLVWFRRDLRVADQTALTHALTHCRVVHCVFVFDRAILDPLPRQDRRVEFIHGAVAGLDAGLRALAGRSDAGLIVRHADAQSEIPRLAEALGVQAVFANHDYEPAAQARDAAVLGALAGRGIAWHSFKDQVIFERDEILTQGGTPYGVFTPYRNAWLRQLRAGPPMHEPAPPDGRALADIPPGLRDKPKLAELGFSPTNLSGLAVQSGEAGALRGFEDFLTRIDRYDQARDFPALKGPSYLSVHLRFGTLSIRHLVRAADARAQAGSSGAQTWLSELIWREFYFQILYHYPAVVSHAFKPAYDAIKWERGKTADAHFAAWCEGRTGYPLVDAAMAQLNQTGYMHNRLRMVTASFLVKHLGLDWRRGERYFAEHLIDYELASNNGGWQWAASTGCDAQPYFRIFNPLAQSRKFDTQGKFIRRYLPQLAALPDALIHEPWQASPVELAAAGVELGGNYPLPIVEHAAARARTLERFAVVRP